MTTKRRSIILKLAGQAYELDLDVASGSLTSDDKGWVIGDQMLDDLLAKHKGEEIVLILGSLEDERPVIVRTCMTCGRDYTDVECPHCRSTRIRLRGHP
jgi:hypothetical protein